MLTDTAIKAAKPRQTPYKLFDGGGLYVLVTTTGSRLWRLKYRHENREKLLAIGEYPHVPLALARTRRDDAKKLLADDTDPGAERRKAKAATANTFEAVALEWLAQQTSLAPATFAKAEWTLKTLLFPELGKRQFAKINPVDVLDALKKIEAKGHHETAHRARQRASQVFRYAVITRKAPSDVTRDLRGALKPVEVEHHASITEPGKIGELLRAIDGYSGHHVTAYALKLAPLLFVRPGELRRAEWSEFDLKGNEPSWRIPAEKMKMGDEHLVPLAPQSVAILRELEKHTGEGKYLFPSLLSAARPMSDNTVNSALRRMGYDADTMTGHGFRSMASTCLNELGYHPDLIELQLAHQERNAVRAAYNKAKRLAERRAMMFAWADYLDGLRTGGKVIPIRRKAK